MQKQTDYTWICMRVTLVPKAVKRLGKSSTLYLKKNFGWECGFFVSDVISGGLLGHVGLLQLALGPNR